MEDIKKMEIRDEINNYVNSKRFVPCSKEELIEHFSFYQDNRVIEEIVNDMLEEYELALTNRRNIQSARNVGIFKGIVTGVNDDYVYVKIDEDLDDFRVSRKSYELVFPDDIVVIRADDPYGHDGEIIKLIDGRKRKLVGEVIIEGYKSGKYEYYIKPSSKRIGYRLKLNKKDTNNLVNGDMVEYSLFIENKKIVPSIIKIIGNKTDPGIDITSKAIEAEVPIEFSKKAVEEAERIGNQVQDIDKEGRVDYTGKEHLVITIDGADTKDRDDAYEIVKEGNILHVKVHISDVAHYVHYDGEIFKDALLRGTSCYLADRVIPMLPRVLSNGICSLDPNVVRLTMSYEFDIDEDGEVFNFNFKPSYIKSSKAFTYDEVQKIIEGDLETIESNKEYLELINLSMEASKRLSERKFKNGELKLNSKEPKIIVNDEGYPIRIEARVQRESERLIEDLMVATNEAGARYISDLDIPFLFRNHEVPEETKLQVHFIPLCESLGIKSRFRNDNFVYEYRRIMSLIGDEMLKSTLSDAFLRCLPKACYQAYEYGHFGLGLKYYAQLTSPIRRLPDLIDQHILHAVSRMESDSDIYQKLLNIREHLVELGESTSSQERRADKLEREVNKMKFAEYMQDHIGEEYVGVVSGFCKNGMFVQLPNLIEGMIPFKTIMEDFYTYDDKKKIVRGRKKGKSFTLGTQVKVSVKRASKDDSQIDFSYIQRL